MDEIENQVKLYPVWSNFIYFIAGMYSLFYTFVVFKNDKYNRKYERIVLFGIFGIILIFTGIFSIIYHLNTPSWKEDPTYIQESEFKKSLNVDSSFAITTTVWALFMFAYIIFTQYTKLGMKSLFIHLINPSFGLSILFIILSIIFYSIAHNYYTKSIECGDKNTKKGKDYIELCFSQNSDAYDIFHSNWHIFTSIAAIFWIDFLKESYTWKKLL